MRTNFEAMEKQLADKQAQLDAFNENVGELVDG